ncbi:leucine-rich repeat flightless-interacting protein 2 isoform X1 [Hoplias malabaricus]|uniref:leucine-rich repeat flightless-interacting protein 2 isoform X1 n=1 Tax=Hoplias malabaricus TaxID=27720 RepID=UPI003462C3BE
MSTQVTGRKRIPNREKLTAEDDALSQIAREAEVKLAAKRAARAEAREIRMKELERQQKEIYQAQKKYYGLDSKWGHIEQWMEDSERYSRHSRRHASISDDEERMSVGSRGSLRGNYSDLCSSTSSLPSSRLQNGRPSALFNDAPRSRSHRGSVYEENAYTGARRFSGSSTRGPSDYSGFLGSSSRASSRASSARASPVVEERSDFLEKGSRTASTLSAATLASLGGGVSRRGSCDTSISADTEASIREIKDSLVEVEEKYRKAMVSNAQLDNEKSNLMYQVDTLRDTLLELEELLYETRRECAERTKEYERERHAHNILQFQFSEMKETLKQSEELLTEAQQLRMKQGSYVSEISDLQETLEWKEKKIGALERQKEYSDIVRDERDALRNEVFQLRDALKKHGIVLGSELTTNGETKGNAIDGTENEESPSRLDQDASTPIMSGDNLLERSPEVQAPETDSASQKNPRANIGCMLHEAISEEPVANQGDVVGTLETPCTKATGTTMSKSSNDKPIIQMEEDMQILNVYAKLEFSNMVRCSEHFEEKSTNQQPLTHPQSVSTEGHVIPAEEQAQDKAVNYVIRPRNEPQTIRNTSTMKTPHLLIKDVNNALPADQTNPQLLSHSANITMKCSNEMVKETAIPGTSQDLHFHNVEMTTTSSEDLSSTHIQNHSETDSELRSDGPQDGTLGMPVEERGFAVFVDSCEEAGALDFEGVTLDQSYMPITAHPKKAAAAGHKTKPNSMRLKTKESHDCTIS